MNNNQVIDYFCDASLGIIPLRGSCGGFIRHDRSKPITESNYVELNVQPYGTNNSGELLAIMLAVQNAAKEYGSIPQQERPIINIFSDSKISVMGIRAWLFKWPIIDGVFYTSTGTPVSNQIYIKIIINTIVLNDLKVNFLHQKGHVGLKIGKAEETFHKSNHVTCMDIGVSPVYITSMNDMIDRLSRDHIKSYQKIELRPGQYIEDLLYRVDDTADICYYRMDKNLIDRYRHLIGVTMSGYMNQTRKGEIGM